MKKLIEFFKIVVHAGKSHFDERMAVALALAANNVVVPVYRRDPTPDEIEDCNVLVLDIGGQSSDWWNCFDHHQLERTAPAACAFSLVAEALGVASDLDAFFGWYSTWRTIDAKGPFQWAKEHGVDWSVTSTLLNPENDLVGEWWEEAHDDVPVDETLVRRLKKQGEKIIAAAERFRAFCDRADQWSHPEFGGVKVMDFTWASPDESLDFGNAYAKSKGIVGGVLVSRDNRGPGLALFRREDDPRVDFSVLDGHPEVTFAHKGGFIAKTVAGAKWHALVRAAIKS